MTWSGVATRLLRVVRGRGPWVVDLICIHGSSIGGQFVFVAIGFLGSLRGRRLHLPCAAPCGGLACGGWRPALDPDVGVPRNELASSSPCGDERAAGPTRFFIARARFEFSRSRVFIASFGRRGRPSPLQLRATCCRIRLRLFRHAATSVLRGLPAFLSLGRVLCVSGFSSRRAWPWGRMGFATVPRAWAAVGFCVDRCDAKAAGGGVVGSRWRTAPLRARTLGGFFSPPAG